MLPGIRQHKLHHERGVLSSSSVLVEAKGGKHSDEPSASERRLESTDSTRREKPTASPRTTASVGLDPFSLHDLDPPKSGGAGRSGGVSSSISDAEGAGAQIIKRIVKSSGGVEQQPFLNLVHAFLSAKSATVLDLSEGCLKLATNEQLELCITTALRFHTSLKCVDVRGYCTPTQAQLLLQLLRLNFNVELVLCAGCDIPHRALLDLAEQCVVNRELCAKHLRQVRARERRAEEMTIQAQTRRLAAQLDKEEGVDRQSIERESDRAKGKIWAQEHMHRVSTVHRERLRVHNEVYDEFLYEKAAEEADRRESLLYDYITSCLQLVQRLEQMDRTAWSDEKSRRHHDIIVASRSAYEQVRTIETRRAGVRRLQRLRLEADESDARRGLIITEVRYRSAASVSWKDTTITIQRIAFERADRDAAEARRRRLEQDKVDKERQQVRERARFDELRGAAEKVRERERLFTRFVSLFGVVDREEQSEFNIVREVFVTATAYVKAYVNMCIAERAVAAACLDAVPSCSIGSAPYMYTYAREEVRNQRSPFFVQAAGSSIPALPQHHHHHHDRHQLSMRAGALRGQFTFETSHKKVTLRKLESLTVDAQAKRRIAFEKFVDAELALVGGPAERAELLHKYGYRLPQLEPYVLPNPARFIAQRLLLRSVRLSFRTSSEKRQQPEECCWQELISLRGLAGGRSASVKISGVQWSVIELEQPVGHVTDGGVDVRATALTVEATFPGSFSVDDANRNVCNLLGLLEYLVVVDKSGAATCGASQTAVNRTITVGCLRTIDGVPSDRISDKTKRLVTVDCLERGVLAVESQTEVTVRVLPPLWSDVSGRENTIPASESGELGLAANEYVPEDGLLAPFQGHLLNTQAAQSANCNGYSLTVTMIVSYPETPLDDVWSCAQDEKAIAARTPILGLRCVHGLLSIVDKESGGAAVGSSGKRINIGAAYLFPLRRNAFVCRIEGDHAVEDDDDNDDADDRNEKELGASDFFCVPDQGPAATAVGANNTIDTRVSELSSSSSSDEDDDDPWTPRDIDGNVNAADAQKNRKHAATMKLKIELGDDGVTLNELDQLIRQAVVVGIPPSTFPRPAIVIEFRLVVSDDTDTCFEMLTTTFVRERPADVPLVMFNPDRTRPLCNHPGPEPIVNGTFSQTSLSVVKQSVEDWCVSLLPQCTLIPSRTVIGVLTTSFGTVATSSNDDALQNNHMMSISFAPRLTAGDRLENSSLQVHPLLVDGTSSMILNEKASLNAAGGNKVETASNAGSTASGSCLVAGSIVVTAVGPGPLQVLLHRPVQLVALKKWPLPPTELTHTTTTTALTDGSTKTVVKTSLIIPFSSLSLRRVQHVLRCLFAFNANVVIEPLTWECSLELVITDPISTGSVRTKFTVRELPMLFATTKRRQKIVEGGATCGLGPFQCNAPDVFTLPNCLNGGYLRANIASGAGPEDLLVVKHPQSGPLRLVLSNVTRRRQPTTKIVEKVPSLPTSPRAGGLTSLTMLKVNNKLAKIDEATLQQAFAVGATELLSVLSGRRGSRRLPPCVSQVVDDPSFDEDDVQLPIAVAALIDTPHESHEQRPPIAKCTSAHTNSQRPNSSSTRSFLPSAMRRAGDCIRLHVREQTAEYGALLSDMRRIAMLASVSRHYHVYATAPSGNDASPAASALVSGAEPTFLLGTMIITRTSFQIDFAPFDPFQPPVTMTEVRMLLDQIGYVCDPCGQLTTDTKLVDMRFRACDGPEGRLAMLLAVQKTENYPLIQLVNSSLVYDPSSYLSAMVNCLPLAPYAQLLVQDQGLVPFFDGGLLTVELERGHCDGDEVFFMGRDEQLKSKQIFDIWRQEQVFLMAAGKPVAPEVEELLSKFQPYEGIAEMQATGKVVRTNVFTKAKGEEAKFGIGTLTTSPTGNKITVQLLSGPTEASYFVSKVNVMALLNGIGFRSSSSSSNMLPSSGRRTVKITLRRGNVKVPLETIIRLTIDVVSPQLYSPLGASSKSFVTKKIMRKTEAFLLDTICVDLSPLVLSSRDMRLKQGFLEVRVVGPRSEDSIFFSTVATGSGEATSIGASLDVVSGVPTTPPSSGGSAGELVAVCQLGPLIYLGQDFIGTLLIADRMQIKIDFDWASAVTSHHIASLLKSLRIRCPDRSVRREVIVEVLLGTSERNGGVVLVHTIAVLVEERAPVVV